MKIGEVSKAVWVIKEECYSSSDTWEAVQNRKPIVEWWKLVWFGIPIPKQAFILWLAIRNGLTTGEKLLSWGYNGEANCVFCRGCIESREHLFFECGYSRRLWRELLKKTLIHNPPLSWSDIKRMGVNEWRKKSFKTVICKLSMSVAVYYL